MYLNDAGNTGRRVLVVLTLIAISAWAAPVWAGDHDWEREHRSDREYDDDLDRGHHFGGGYFMIGWSALDLSDLNASLAAHGYPRFDESFLSLGGAGHFSAGRLIIGGQGHGYLSETHDATLPAGTYRTELSGGVGFFDLGYQFVQGGRTRAALLAGLGGGELKLKMVDLSGPSFEDVLTNPGRSAELSTAGFLIDLGVSVDVVAGHVQGHGARGGPLLGVRAGYIFAPVKGDWQLADRDIAGGPRMGMEGAYVRALLGFGGGR